MYIPTDSSTPSPCASQPSAPALDPGYTIKLQHRAAQVAHGYSTGDDLSKVTAHIKWQLAMHTDDWAIVLPNYDRHSMEWLMNHLASQRGLGAVECVLNKVTHLLDEKWATLPDPPGWTCRSC